MGYEKCRKPEGNDENDDDERLDGDPSSIGWPARFRINQKAGHRFLFAIRRAERGIRADFALPCVAVEKP